MSRQKKHISKEIYQELFKLKLNKSDSFDSWVINQMTYNMLDLNMTLNRRYTSSLLRRIEKNINQENWQNLACTLYKLYPENEQKEKCKELITSQLKSSFKPKTFFNAVINDLIDYDEKLLKEYAEISLPKLSTDIMSLRSYKESFGSDIVTISEKRFSKTDEFFNVVFKLNISLNKEYKDRAKHINKYYEWLSDLDNFDYTYFDPEWINEHFTIYYNMRFYKSKVLQKHLTDFISSDKSYGSQTVLNNYINIYIRKTWNKKEWLS